MADLNIRQTIGLVDGFDKSKLAEPVISETARYIAETRYAIKDDTGKPRETIKDLFWRVASNIAMAERGWGGDDARILNWAVTFYELMAKQWFMPNTPCLVNAGKRYQQLSACFVLPIEDDMGSILETMANMAMIHKTGGGTGFSFSRLRPSGDYIKSSGGTTVGPVSFLQAYNDVTSQIKQGGVRRGANMGMLSIDHPDVLRFAVAKLDEFSITNFNLSLAVTNVFMDKIDEDKKFVTDDAVPEGVVEEIRTAEQNRDIDARLRQVEAGVIKLYDWAEAKADGEGYNLVNPRNGQTVRRLNAYKVFNLITRLAWQYGDPGLVFIDRMNEASSNPVPKLGKIEATNPCGEQPLLPYDACNLGSINLAKFVGRRADGDNFDWDNLATTVRTAVRFLDDVVEVNEFPVAKIREMVSQTRRIGLGVMGFADALFLLGVRYDSDVGVEWAGRIMKFVGDKAREATVELGRERGVFPAWEISLFAGSDYRPRNMALTTIAPTGTISIVADTSSGIEPIFSLGYQKNTVEGKTLYIVNPVLTARLKELGLYSEELLRKITDNGGRVTGVAEIPVEIQEIFRTALEIDPEWHIRIQTAFQKYTDNAVSKTINFAKEATVDQVRQAYRLAYQLGTKGITIYRSGSREKEVIQQVKNEEKLQDQSQKIGPKKKATPEVARGVRIRKPCDMGRVYTSVFFEAGDGPVEVFVILGKSGGYLAGAAEVTGRLASLALKYGAGLDEVAHELVGVSCGQKVGLGKETILSMFDAVGKSLLEIAKGEQLNLFNEEKHEVKLLAEKGDKTGYQEALRTIRSDMAKIDSKFAACPDCGSQLYAEEGCYKCSNPYCGYSKCS